MEFIRREWRWKQVLIFANTFDTRKTLLALFDNILYNTKLIMANDFQRLATFIRNKLRNKIAFYYRERVRRSHTSR